MLYRSTRGGLGGITSAEAIKMGIAPDGGLFVPETGVRLALENIASLAEVSYQERAAQILQYYLDDYTPEEIKDCVDQAYNSKSFQDRRIAPLYKLNENAYVLELWHGPTCAFKDMALQILPHLLVKAMQKLQETAEIVILVATSGDTGKAALEGFRDVQGTRIIVFYPENGVSEVQRLQMVTQKGGNVASIAVRGNFDDAQNGVKAIFGDASLMEKMQQKGYRFSSANSINWGRLVPQVVYYFSAYADLLKTGGIKPGEKVNFVVPTGNFGNILAAYYAMRMGLPVNRLICASNENNVLTDFINTGTYDRKRQFKRTNSPSMDILISSNLERLLFEITGQDSERINDWMLQLKEEGAYTVDSATRKEISKLFWAGYTTEDETMKTIDCVYRENDYVVDTHTAVAIDVYDKYVISTGDMTKTVVVSTASPFKFNESVAGAIFGEEAVQGKDEFKLLDLLSDHCGLPIPEGLRELDKKPVLHTRVCGRTEMKEEVAKALKL